jgi:ABC-type arginine transport system ATPase subunit
MTDHVPWCVLHGTPKFPAVVGPIMILTSVRKQIHRNALQILHILFINHISDSIPLHVRGQLQKRLLQVAHAATSNELAPFAPNNMQAN